MQRVTDDPRILIFDIESTNLKANFGYCLCFGYKWLGDTRAKVISVLDYPQHKSDPTNDAHLMRAAHRILTEQADIIVSYYGKEFDRKFLNTRMILAGLSPLPPLSSEHVDLYYTVRGNFSLHSKRLDVVAKTLGAPVQKTVLDGPTWVRGSAGHVPSIKYIIKHCAADVNVLEWCYLKLRPFIRTHPKVSTGDACNVCGGTAFQRRGYSITKAQGRAQRQQCRGCGAWRSVKV